MLQIKCKLAPSPLAKTLNILTQNPTFPNQNFQRQKSNNEKASVSHNGTKFVKMVFCLKAQGYYQDIPKSHRSPVRTLYFISTHSLHARRSNIFPFSSKFVYMIQVCIYDIGKDRNGKAISCQTIAVFYDPQYYSLL